MVIKHKGPSGKGLGALKGPRDQIRNFAIEYGLDFFDTVFEFLDYEEMSMVAAYGGFPNRYPHWKFGMEYERLRKSYKYGLHKIYEMVVNTDPCYAYLLESNNLVDQKIVMAHVFGHSDFFKNNTPFAHTNRKMMDTMANHANKVRKYMDKHGLEAVENFIDVCDTVDDLIDPHSMFIRRRNGEKESMLVGGEEEQRPLAKKIPAKGYMNGFVNPEEALKKEQRRLETEHERKKQIKRKEKFPESPEKDILLFLVEHAPLEEWQREILWMIREEAYYFAPQAETKIMNEGWATYWHRKIMIERVLNDSEIIDFADHHSGTVAAHNGQINPYRLGLQLWQDIEDRWNKGKFGGEYDDCDEYLVRKSWDKQLGLGREKIFEVRRVCNDITFIDAFFTEEFCFENKYFTYAFNENTGMYEIVDRNWKRVKRGLLSNLTNRGKPFIYVANGNYKNRGELLLVHRHEGIDLEVVYAKAVLPGLYSIWKRPVYIRTIVEGKAKLFMCDKGGVQELKAK